jgi:hypothetical protein
MAEQWQNLVIKAGENKTITVPLGKLVDFLPCAGTNYVVSGRVEYSGDNIIPFTGNAMITAPTMLVGPVILTINVARPPINPMAAQASFLVVTYRLKANV